ncbi:ferric reduction oxidase 2-like [Malania oleifera]|uniref:ferric reduction oxidase 2-like n=1 Tax=Malania oleifera TaxID=397392 RepID=UPI0025ADBEE5|nr:ferric reduction oxidase 2-like [Malania oleifera]
MVESVIKRPISVSQKGLRCIRRAIWVVLMILFLGNVMIWVISPTDVYLENWLRSIRAKANSTYFGSQGSVLLIHTFPVLFIAVLGCVYLHLGNKLTENELESKRRLPAILKRPVLVKGPLGIVSGTELAFFLMFIALLVWSFSSYLHLSFHKWITPESLAIKKQKLWEARLEWSSLLLGSVGNVCLAVLFFPVTRGSSVLPLFGLTSEGSIKYHIWVGHITMILFTAHGLGYIYVWAATHRLSEVLEWNKTGVSNVAGELSLLSGLVLWATTFPRIRRKFFELFFYTHYLYILFIVFFVFHLGISYSSMMLPGFYLFLLDRYLRFLQSRHTLRLVSARVLPCQTLELNFAKTPGLKYSPTSIMFMNVPSISKLQWHPFTINSSSNLEPDELSIMVKSEGIWSQKLYQMLSSPSPPVRLEVSLEGPYGPVSTHFLRHDTLAMVSGGSGITPFISIIRELIITSTALGRPTPKLLLICAFKTSSSLTMLDLLLPISSTQSKISELQLQIEAYVTREKEPATANQRAVRTVWFQPNPSDAPVSAILGENGWLWLGSIIASSFVIYLILIGVVTRWYIYPIDHNTYKIYPLSARAVISMLLICICIAATASAAVLWNKKQNAAELKHLRNVAATEGRPPAAEASWFCGGGREMESGPQQSLVQATKVHYGERPDLKRMLVDCEGKSVGVLVCGPRKMRREVAAICSFASSNHLHFESISFSW